MDKLLPGIAIAALSGLTFLAYKHHHAYVRLANLLLGVMALAMLGLLIWDTSIFVTHRGLRDLIPLEKQIAALEARDQMYLLSWWFAGGYIAIFIYVQFLVWGLPWLLGDEQPPEKQGEPKGK